MTTNSQRSPSTVSPSSTFICRMRRCLLVRTSALRPGWKSFSRWRGERSFVFGTPGFPLSDVPLQAIAEKLAAGRYKAKPSRVFRFEDIRKAHRVMEANEAKGKLVVRL
jgi:NADPH:quinone reductase-like Zn-dependent oxidoreductase